MIAFRGTRRRLLAVTGAAPMLSGASSKIAPAAKRDKRSEEMRLFSSVAGAHEPDLLLAAGAAWSPAFAFFALFHFTPLTRPRVGPGATRRSDRESDKALQLGMLDHINYCALLSGNDSNLFPQERAFKHRRSGG